MADVDHRAVIAALGKGQRDVLLERSDGPGLVRLAVHWGGIVLFGALIHAAVPLWPALLVIQGILIVCTRPSTRRRSELTG